MHATARLRRAGVLGRNQQQHPAKPNHLPQLPPPQFLDPTTSWPQHRDTTAQILTLRVKLRWKRQWGRGNLS